MPEEDESLLQKMARTGLRLLNPLTAKDTIEGIGDSIPELPGPMDVFKTTGNLVFGDFEDKDIHGRRKPRTKYGEPIPTNPIEELANFGQGGLLKEGWDLAVKKVRGLGKKEDAQTQLAGDDVPPGGNAGLPSAKQKPREIS